MDEMSFDDKIVDGNVVDWIACEDEPDDVNVIGAKVDLTVVRGANV